METIKTELKTVKSNQADMQKKLDTAKSEKADLEKKVGELKELGKPQ